jgi:phospho-N-acetylmuramoyl-pentapeptide-transferase
MIIFGLFIIDLLSSALQIFWKKRFKKKLFSVSPLHHLFENRGLHETTIVMKAWMLQAILAAIAIVMLFYQINGAFMG